MKGISAVIAVVLILMITVALGAVGYVFFTDTFEETASGVSEQTESLVAKGQAQFEIDTLTSSIIYLRNTGAADLNEFNVYVNNEQVDFDIDPTVLLIDGIATITLTENILPGSSVKITTAQGAEVEKTIALSEEEAETGEIILEGDVCGDGNKEGIEECDGNVDCSTLGDYESGNLATCINECTEYDTSTCVDIILEPQEIILSPIADTTYEGWAGALDHAYGGYDYLQIGPDDDCDWRTTIRFDTSSLIGKTIESAELKLYAYTTTDSGGSIQTTVSRVIHDWDETIVTWNVFRSQYPYIESTPTILDQIIDPVEGWKLFDLTTDVQGFADETYTNYGWDMKSDLYDEIGGWSHDWDQNACARTGAMYRRFIARSKEYADSDYHPKLVVYYFD